MYLTTVIGNVMRSLVGFPGLSDLSNDYDDYGDSPYSENYFTKWPSHKKSTQIVCVPYVLVLELTEEGAYESS
jgi:hypothetical protein